MRSPIKKILLVSPLPPPIGGITSWTEDYLLKMREWGYDISVVNTSVTGNRIKINSRVNVWDEIKRLFIIKKNIGQLLTNVKPQVMHYNASCFTMGLIRDYIVLRKYFNRVPIVYQCHCNLGTNINNKIASFFFKKICNKSKIILTLNNESCGFAKRYTDRVKVVPNFITALYRDEPCVQYDLKNIVYVGRVSVLKGIRELMEAAEECSDIFFHIVGPDDEHILNEYKLGNVKCYGAQKHDDVIKIMKSMDAIVLPSYSEGFPLVVLEAMSCALPVLATPVGSVPDMIENKGGVLLELKNARSIVKAIEMIKPFSVRKEMADYNLKKAANQYLCESVLSNLVSIYGEVQK